MLQTSKWAELSVIFYIYWLDRNIRWIWMRLTAWYTVTVLSTDLWEKREWHLKGMSQTSSLWPLCAVKLSLSSCWHIVDEKSISSEIISKQTSRPALIFQGVLLWLHSTIQWKTMELQGRIYIHLHYLHLWIWQILTVYHQRHVYIIIHLCKFIHADMFVDLLNAMSNQRGLSYNPFTAQNAQVFCSVMSSACSRKLTLTPILCLLMISH